jgi:hypothetical protein
MNKTRQQALEFLLKRLREPRAGCAEPFPGSTETQARGYEGISRIYIETWLAGPVELLLSDNNRDQKLALDMLRR